MSCKTIAPFVLAGFLALPTAQVNYYFQQEVRQAINPSPQVFVVPGHLPGLAAHHTDQTSFSAVKGSVIADTEWTVADPVDLSRYTHQS